MTSIMSWKDSSSLVIFPLKDVTIAGALSDESLTGCRPEIALLIIEFSGVSLQSSPWRKVWSILSREKRRVDRCPTEPGSVLEGVMTGSVGFFISTLEGAVHQSSFQAHCKPLSPSQGWRELWKYYLQSDTKCVSVELPGRLLTPLCCIVWMTQGSRTSSGLWRLLWWGKGMCTNISGSSEVWSWTLCWCSSWSELSGRESDVVTGRTSRCGGV